MAKCAQKTLSLALAIPFRHLPPPGSGPNPRIRGLAALRSGCLDSHRNPLWSSHGREMETGTRIDQNRILHGIHTHSMCLFAVAFRYGINQVIWYGLHYSRRNQTYCTSSHRPSDVRQALAWTSCRRPSIQASMTTFLHTCPPA